MIVDYARRYLKLRRRFASRMITLIPPKKIHVTFPKRTTESTFPFHYKCYCRSMISSTLSKHRWLDIQRCPSKMIGSSSVVNLWMLRINRKSTENVELLFESIRDCYGWKTRVKKGGYPQIADGRFYYAIWLSAQCYRNSAKSQCSFLILFFLRYKKRR